MRLQYAARCTPPLAAATAIHIVRHQPVDVARSQARRWNVARRRMVDGTVAPLIEAMLWCYAKGKPLEAPKVRKHVEIPYLDSPQVDFCLPHDLT